MKAIEFIEALSSECLDLSVCGVVDGAVFDEVSIERFFGVNYCSTEIDHLKTYFYYYGEASWIPSVLEIADVEISSEDEECVVYMWIIE